MIKKEELLGQIACANPSNEAEVETKILLHIFRLLGYTDIDRADKPKVDMYYGHEKKQKIPDFILYDGEERTLNNALVAIEAKKIGESLDNARNQVLSYAQWAGTPFYLVCNGEILQATQFIPTINNIKLVEFKIKDIVDEFKALEALLQKNEVILIKERLSYITCYLPNIENLPPNEFFYEYLSRLQTRFSNSMESINALTPPNPNELILPRIPVTTKIYTMSYTEITIAEILQYRNELIYVQGEPGSGKSTLCKRITDHITKYALNPGNNILPIYTKLTSGIPASILDVFKCSCDELGVRFFPNLYKKSIEKLHLVLILDGLDEYLEFREEKYKDSLEKLGCLIKECNGHSILITSRPFDSTIDDFFLTRNFMNGKIRKLTDEELFCVFNSYLDNDKLVDSILSNMSGKKGIDLHSPLMALMVIRIVKEQGGWYNLNIFTLYEKYVKILNDFFNNSLVRGNDVEIDINKILEILSKSAVVIKSMLPKTINLYDLVETLKRDYKPTEIKALLNTGIITSDHGKVSFIHASFEDFAIAWHLINSLRKGNYKDFTVSGPTDFSYDIANSALSDEDEKRLCDLLYSSDVSLRRRAIGILKHGCSEKTVSVVRELQSEESSNRVWAAMGKLLVLNKDYEFLESISGTIKSSRRLNAIGTAMRKSDDRDFLPFAIKLAELRRSIPMLTCVFTFALKFDETSVYTKLLQFYRQASISQKEAICSIIGAYRDGELGRNLIKDVLKIEKSPKMMIYLLNMLKPPYSEIDIDISKNIHNVLIKPQNLSVPNFSRLKKVISQIESEETLTEQLKSILDGCQKLQEFQLKNKSN